jgi:hypothetical protein
MVFKKKKKKSESCLYEKKFLFRNSNRIS